MKPYLIVYYWKNKLSSGLGNVDGGCAEGALSVDTVREMERRIRETNGYDNVVILNLIPMEG